MSKILQLINVSAFSSLAHKGEHRDYSHAYLLELDLIKFRYDGKTRIRDAFNHVLDIIDGYELNYAHILFLNETVMQLVILSDKPINWNPIKIKLISNMSLMLEETIDYQAWYSTEMKPWIHE